MITVPAETEVGKTGTANGESVKMSNKQTRDERATERSDLGDLELTASCMDMVPLMFEKGKRFFSLEEYDKALEFLGQAAKMCEQFVGPDSEEWAPLYFLYGHALAMNHFKWGGDLLEAEAVSRKTKESKVLSGEAAAEQMQETGKLVFEGDDYADDAEVYEDEDMVGDYSDEGSVVDDLELAWDWIEIARSTYQRLADGGNVEAKKMLGDVHGVLGDIQLENEQISDALDDYETALAIKRTVYPEDSRILSEAYYKCACAFEIDNRLDEAVEQVEFAIQVMKKCLESYEQKAKLISGSDKGKQPVTSEYTDLMSEIDSLKGDLIPSLEAKIRDLQALKQEESKPPVEESNKD